MIDLPEVVELVKGAFEKLAVSEPASQPALLNTAIAVRTALLAAAVLALASATRASASAPPLVGPPAGASPRLVLLRLDALHWDRFTCRTPQKSIMHD